MPDIIQEGGKQAGRPVYQGGAPGLLFLIWKKNILVKLVENHTTLAVPAAWETGMESAWGKEKPYD